MCCPCTRVTSTPAPHSVFHTSETQSRHPLEEGYGDKESEGRTALQSQDVMVYTCQMLQICRHCPHLHITNHAENIEINKWVEFRKIMDIWLIPSNRSLSRHKLHFIAWSIHTRIEGICCCLQMMTAIAHCVVVQGVEPMMPKGQWSRNIITRHNSHSSCETSFHTGLVMLASEFETLIGVHASDWQCSPVSDHRMMNVG